MQPHMDFFKFNCRLLYQYKFDGWEIPSYMGMMKNKLLSSPFLTYIFEQRNNMYIALHLLYSPFFLSVLIV